MKIKFLRNDIFFDSSSYDCFDESFFNEAIDIISDERNVELAYGYCVFDNEYSIYIHIVFKIDNEFYRFIFNGETDFWPIKYNEIRTDKHMIGGVELLKINYIDDIENSIIQYELAN